MRTKLLRRRTLDSSSSLNRMTLEHLGKHDLQLRAKRVMVFLGKTDGQDVPEYKNDETTGLVVLFFICLSLQNF